MASSAGCNHLWRTIQVNKHAGQWCRTERCLEDNTLMTIDEIEIPFILKAYEK